MSDATVGQTLRGGYRVINVLRGGMGVVYICHQEATDQLYAVKTVRFDGSMEDVEGRLKRFGNEVNHWIRISRESNCDKIVTALTFDADERLLILEFVDGLPLNSLVRKGRPIHPCHFIDWSRDVAEGMRELHSRFQLIHRDLKPANVLVARKDLSAKITDLGIGKVLLEDEETGTLIGTPKFMAPENFEGKASFRSDIYSYGATLYWMLTLKHPVPLRGELDDRALAFPPRTKALLEKCLQEKPEDRYESFSEVLADLEGLDRVEDFPFDSEGYVFCEHHRFWSPLPAADDEPLPEGKSPCLFCDQQQELDRQITSTLRSADLARDPELRGYEPTRKLDQPGGTGTLDVPPPVDVGPRPAPDAVGSRRTLLIAGLVAATAGAGGLAWLAWRKKQGGAGDGGDTTPGGTSGSGGTAAGGSPATGGAPPNGGKCAEEGCELPVASNEAFERFRLASADSAQIRLWTPTRCAAHSPVVCTRCGRRHTEGEWLEAGEACASCGHPEARREES